MDIDDDLNEHPQLPSRTSRFAPKSKSQPKSKHPPKQEPKSEPPPAVVSGLHSPASATEVVVKKEEDSHSEFLNGDEDILGPKEEDGLSEEDYVVAEYDVCYNPADADTQLYVFQYPLRPSWRPYESFDQRCTEVRIKPKSERVEIDLEIDKNSCNYDPNAYTAELMKKQILSSSWLVPEHVVYAVGVLASKKLYLNPIQAVVQLRTSMKYLDKTEGAGSAVPVGSSRRQSQQVDPKESESWIPLKYYSPTDDTSERYFRRMMTAVNNPLEFSMHPIDYLNSICPGSSTSRTESSEPSKRYLFSLPLEERFKTLFIKGPSVHRFNTLKHYAPDDPVEDVLEILESCAHLVQGLWVAKTALRFPTLKSTDQLVRDFALFLFSRSPVVKSKYFSLLGSLQNRVKVVVQEFATERTSCKDWKFTESTDDLFIKLHPDVLERQRNLWKAPKTKLESFFKGRGKDVDLDNYLSPERNDMPGSSIHSDEVPVKAKSEAQLQIMSMSKETREALPKVLRKVFQTHKVCSFQTVCQGLRDMAVSMSTLPKADGRAAVAAASSVDGPPEELQAVLKEVAANIHGVYVWKVSEYPELSPLREVVIDLFIGSGRSAKLKKSEVIEAAKIKLRREPTNTEFQKVMTELCISQGGTWMLRSGDGVSKVS